MNNAWAFIYLTIHYADLFKQVFRAFLSFIPSIRLPRCSHCDPYRIAAMPETKLKGPKKILEWDQRRCTRHPDNSRFTRNLHSSPDMNRLQWKPHLARTAIRVWFYFSPVETQSRQGKREGWITEMETVSGASDQVKEERNNGRRGRRRSRKSF